jgi:hypothetical protein
MRLTSSTKRVAPGVFPHASKKLGETTAEDSHPNYNIWVGDVTRLKVVQGQNESGGSKREQAAIISLSWTKINDVRRNILTEEQGWLL